MTTIEGAGTTANPFKVKDLGIITAKLANGAVTPIKIASGSNNTVLVTDATGNVAWLDSASFGAVADMTTIEGAGTTASPFKVKDLGIVTNKIADLAVTNAKLAADAVTTDKILDGEVQTADIKNLNVTTPKLADSAVTTTKIASGGNNTVLVTDATGNVAWVDRSSFGAIADMTTIEGAGTTANPFKVKDLGIITAKLANGAVTPIKIASGSNNTVLVTDVTGNVAWVDRASFGAIADMTTIEGAGTTASPFKVKDLGIVTSKIADLAVTNAKLAADAVTTDKILDGEIQTADIKNLNVTTPKLADATVTTIKIASGGNNKVLVTDNSGAVAWIDKDAFGVMADQVSIEGAGTTASPFKVKDLGIVTSKIADLAVTNAKLAADAVTTDKILDGEVQTADIKNLNVTTPKLADAAVTTTKLASGANNTVLVTDATGNVAWLDSASFGAVADMTTIEGAGTTASPFKVKDLGIVTNKLANASVTTNKIAPGVNNTVLVTDFMGNVAWIDSGSFGAVADMTTIEGAGTTASPFKVKDLGIITQKLANNAVTSPKIANAAVTTSKIASGGNNKVLVTDNTGVVAWIDGAAFGAVADMTTIEGAGTTASPFKVKDLGIITAKLADAAVTTVKIADLNVTTSKIADANVTNAKLADLNVTTNKLANAAVTTTKIASGGNNKVLVTDASGNVAWLDATAFGAIADMTSIEGAGTSASPFKVKDLGIITSKLADNAVTTNKIADLNITTNKVANNAITSVKLADLNVTTEKINNAAVTTSKIASGGNNKVLVTDNFGVVAWLDATAFGAVADMTTIEGAGTTASPFKVKDLGIVTNKLANLAVTNAKLAADAVTTDKILDGEVQTADIKNLNVTTEKLNDAAVTTTKIASGGTNKVLVTDGTGTVAWINATAFGAVADMTTIEGAGTTASPFKVKDLGIVTNKLADLAVTNAKLAANAVTSDKILDGEVQTADIKNLNVTTEKLNDAAVTTTKIASGSNNTVLVTDATGNVAWINTTAFGAVADMSTIEGAGTTASPFKVKDLSIITNKLADGAVTTSKIASGGINKVLVTDSSGNVAWLDATAFGAIADMNTIEGSGTSASPFKVKNLGIITEKLANDAVTSPKILDGTIIVDDLANDAVETAKIKNLNVTTNKLADDAVTTGKILNGTISNVDIADDTITTDKIAGQIAVSEGGTGSNMSNTIGYVKQNTLGSSFTTVTSIPVADVAGAVRKVNGVSPNTNGEVTINWGTVYSGTLANIATVVPNPANGDTYVIAGDTSTNNGRTFIYDGTNWLEVTPNQAALDARYLRLTGDTMQGDIIIPSSNRISISDLPTNPTDATNKAYVDAQIASGAPDATSAVNGKIRLAGDLAGTGSTAAAPIITNNAITTSKLEDNAVTTDKILDGEVQTADIKDLNVTTAKINDAAVTTTKIASGGNNKVLVTDNTGVVAWIDGTAFGAVADMTTIEGAGTTASPFKVKDLGIVTNKLANLAVTNAKLAADAVTTDKILDGQVQTADIKDLNVTTAKINDAAVTTTKIASGANSTVLVTDASGNVAWINANAFGAVADMTTIEGLGTTASPFKVKDLGIVTNKLADLAVTNAKLAADAVTTDKILDGQVQTADIKDLNVTTAKINDAAVTTTKIASGANSTVLVTDASGNVAWINANAFGAVADMTTIEGLGTTASPFKVKDLGIVTNKLADLAVTNAKLAENAVTTDKILDGEVQTADIKNLNVTTEKLNDAAVTTTKIASGGTNKVLVTDNSGVVAWINANAFGAVADQETIEGAGTSASPFKVKDLGIITDKLANLAVNNAKLAENAVTTDKILDGEVQTADIKNLNVTTEKINDAAVTTTKIADANVTTTKLANASVTTTKIASGGNSKVLVTDNTGVVTWIDATDFGAVADMTTIEGAGTTTSPFKVKDLGIITAKLANDAVTSPKILDGTIIVDDLANDAVETSKIKDLNVTTVKLANDAVTSGKILNETILNEDIADNTITTSKIAGQIAVSDGGTGSDMSSTLGYVKQASSGSNFTTVTKIPVADVDGAVIKVNGNLPDSNGNVTVALGMVSTGILANIPLTTTPGLVNGDIYVVSGDSNPLNNGLTFIFNDSPAQWLEVTPNQAALDARYLRLAGGTMQGDIVIPATKKITITDAPNTATDAVNKAYVDAQIASGAPDATTSLKGKIQLGGDLAGTGTTAETPIITDNAITTNKINPDAVTTDKIQNGTIISADLADAIITNAKLAETITVPNGGTGATTLTGYVKGNGTSAMTAVATIPVADIVGAQTTANLASDITANTGSTTLYPSVAAVEAFVANSATPDATTVLKGKIKLAGDLSGTADLPTVPGLALKAPLDSPLLTGVPVSPTAAQGTNTTQIATTEFVTTAVAAATIADATSTIKGKLQLAGDLAGTGSSAASPVISNNAITTSKILDDAVTNAKIGEIISVENGGTGSNMTTTAGYVKQATIGANLSTVSTIPVADVTGAVRSVNGVVPSTNGNVAVIIGRVFTGATVDPNLATSIISASPPKQSSDIYIVADGSNPNNGRTFIYDGTNWLEVATDLSTTDARYVNVAGDTMEGDLIVPTGTKIIITDAPTASTHAVNKAYVDNLISSSATPDATASIKGKIKLAGDLGGTADLPTVPGLALKAPLESPGLTGTPTAPTATAGNNTTQIATTAFVTTAVTAASGTPFYTAGTTNDVLSNKTVNIYTNKNIGIGTSAPQNNIDVVGGVSIRSTAGASGTGFGMEINTSSNAPRIDWVSNGSYIGQFSSDNNDFFLRNSKDNTGNIRFFTKTATFGQERLTILNNGNVGIGTSAPLTKLVVNDNAYIASLPASSNNLMDNTTFRPLTRFQTTSGVNNNAISHYLTTTAAATQAHNYSTGASLPYVLQPGGGNVGIGATAPAARLHIQGIQATLGANANATMLRMSRPTWSGQKWGSVAQFNLGTYVDSGNNVDSKSRLDLALANGNDDTTLTTTMTWLANGNVGINNTAPSAPLVVQGVTGTGALKLIAPSAASGDNWWLGFGHGTTSTDGNDRARIGAEIISGGAGRLFFTTGLSGAQTRAMFIDESQRVGIGTNTPLNKLVVTGTNNSVSALGTNQTNATFRVDGNSNHALDMGTFTNSPWGSYIQSHNKASTASLPLSLNPVGGNVGIGTSNPDYKLSVIGNTRIQPNTTNTGTGGGNLWVEIYGKEPPATDTQAGGIKLGWYNNFGGIEVVRPGSTTGVGLAFNYATTGGTTTEGFRLTNAGRVGIGTTNPGSTLEVNGSSTNTAALNNGAANAIAFSLSNLAYTSLSAQLFNLTGMKDGGTYTLAVQGTTSGISSFMGANPSGTAFVFKSINNGTTIAGKDTLYTFVVMGTTVYVYMATGF